MCSQRTFPSESALRMAISGIECSTAIHKISNRLSYLGRREDALEASLESVDLRRRLAADRPATFNTDLAKSLNSLSHCLSDLGRRGDALAAILEAVDLYQRLAGDPPAAFNSDLADSLYNISNCQSNLGYREDALEEIQATFMCRSRLDRKHILNTSHNFILSHSRI